jgi:hypothetical protein
MAASVKDWLYDDDPTLELRRKLKTLIDKGQLVADLATLPPLHYETNRPSSMFSRADKFIGL